MKQSSWYITHAYMNAAHWSIPSGTLRCDGQMKHSVFVCMVALYVDSQFKPHPQNSSHTSWSKSACTNQVKVKASLPEMEAPQG